MSTRKTIAIVLILVVLATAAAALHWNQLPDPMASHWDMQDRVNGSLPKFWGVFLLPLITLGLLALCLLIPMIDPLKANIAQFRNIFNLFSLFLVLFLMYTYALTIAWNLGFTQFRMGISLLPAAGLLIIVIGLMLRQTRRNFFIGIRTPWTLSSDHVWDATHRIGGWLLVASGVLALIGALYGGLIAVCLILVPLLTSTVFLVIYSYVLYQRETHA
jgi:uncharacterized membrane protein